MDHVEYRESSFLVRIWLSARPLGSGVLQTERTAAPRTWSIDPKFFCESFSRKFLALVVISCKARGSPFEVSQLFPCITPLWRVAEL